MRASEVFAAAVTRRGPLTGATLAESRRLEPFTLKAGNTVPGPVHTVDAAVMSCVAPSFEEYERVEGLAVPSVRVSVALSTEIVFSTAWVVLTPVLAVWAEAKPPAAATARMLRMGVSCCFPFLRLR